MSARQDQVAELIRKAQEAPGVSEAMAAYERIQDVAVLAVTTTPARVEYATGGNSRA